LIQYS